MKCMAKGCDKSHYGYIDFAFKGKNCPYARMWWCEDHWKPLMKKVDELIAIEKKKQHMGENEFFAFVVPPNITEQVLNVES